MKDSLESVINSTKTDLFLTCFDEAIQQHFQCVSKLFMEVHTAYHPSLDNLVRRYICYMISLFERQSMFLHAILPLVPSLMVLLKLLLQWSNPGDKVLW